DDLVGAVERVQRQRRQQPRIARAAADQPDAARREIREGKAHAVDHQTNLYKRLAEARPGGATALTLPSWPGLTRPSGRTRFVVRPDQRDARIKSGHDET